MAINKKTREAVYQKYGGRCAYCGRAIAYKDMQVDHFRPLRVWNEADGAADDIFKPYASLPDVQPLQARKLPGSISPVYCRDPPQAARQLYL